MQVPEIGIGISNGFPYFYTTVRGKDIPIPVSLAGIWFEVLTLVLFLLFFPNSLILVFTVIGAVRFLINLAPFSFGNVTFDGKIWYEQIKSRVLRTLFLFFYFTLFFGLIFWLVTLGR